MAGREQCLAGCGFFGNPASEGFCSSCYRKFGSGAPPLNTGGHGGGSSQHGGGGFGGGGFYGGGGGGGWGGDFGGFGAPRPKPSGEGKQSTVKFEIEAPLGTGSSEVIKLSVRHGDMTEERVDAIVNAANQALDHASGLAGAIVRKGGQVIQTESDDYYHKHGKLEVGELHVTSAGKLPCHHVFHAVGPIWRGGREGEELLLEMCVRNCFVKADELKLKSIALPAISSGIFGFPKKRCAEIMIDMSLKYARENPTTTMREIHLCNFDDETVQLFEKELRRVEDARKAGGTASLGSAASAGPTDPKAGGGAFDETNPFASDAAAELATDDQDVPPYTSDDDLFDAPVKQAEPVMKEK